MEFNINEPLSLAANGVSSLGFSGIDVFDIGTVSTNASGTATTTVLIPANAASSIQKLHVDINIGPVRAAVTIQRGN